jgi:hypothetical protein
MNTHEIQRGEEKKKGRERQIKGLLVTRVAKLWRGCCEDSNTFMDDGFWPLNAITCVIQKT